MSDEAKIFVHEAPNGFKSKHSLRDLMGERRVYQNSAAPLVSLLFTKGVLSAPEVLDVLGLYSDYKVEASDDAK